MTPEQMLREFHASKAVHGGLMPGQPTTDIPDWVRDLRTRLLLEEVKELTDAAEAGDIVGIADGIADVVFVAVGTAVAYGVPFDAVFSEVFRSNMTKTNTPAEAKLVKGPDYEPPRIAELLGVGNGARPAVPPCPIEAVFYPERFPCRLARGHDGPHSYNYPEPWDDDDAPPA